jgi:gliding motility associated protien GldN
MYRPLLIALAVVATIGSVSAQKKKKSAGPSAADIAAQQAATDAAAKQQAADLKKQQDDAAKQAQSEASKAKREAYNQALKSGYNPYSVRPIHFNNQMYKKTLIRMVDLREKQNQPIFSKGKEITRIIIDAVREGKLTPYGSDSLEVGKVLTKEDFDKALIIPSDAPALTPEELEFQKQNAAEGGAGWGDAGPDPSSLGPNLFNADELYQMEIKEDYIFDRQRSRMYYDMQCFTIKIPAEKNIKGIEIPVATFKYKDLIEVFKNDPRAIWFNSQNDSEHRNMADAFDLRLFSSYLIKVSNPKDQYLADIYTGSAKQAILAAQWKANELMEFEHNLWEF